jgi:ubiquinone/menaquinone biosynthesis C-methylase UbiE
VGTIGLLQHPKGLAPGDGGAAAGFQRLLIFRRHRMNDSDHGQVSRTAAQVYEEFFVPALFAAWPRRVAAAAAVGSGQRVLDVACGTGVLARTAAELAGSTGSVTGLDVNDGMLAVASQMEQPVEWRNGRAEALPFARDSFDAVVSQFGLMFFEDKVTAIQEMARVLRPQGRMAVAVWASLEATPGYTALVDLLQSLLGTEAAHGLRAPFSLGEADVLLRLFHEAGLPAARVATYSDTARFPSLQDWVFTEIRGWTLADSIDDQQYARLSEAADHTLQQFVMADGTVAFSVSAHIVTAQVD